MEYFWQNVSGAPHFLVMSLNMEWPDNSLSRNKKGTVNNFTGKHEQTSGTGLKQGYLRQTREVLGIVDHSVVRHSKAG